LDSKECSGVAYSICGHTSSASIPPSTIILIINAELDRVYPP
jgi:hypothetical protein